MECLSPLDVEDVCLNAGDDCPPAPLEEWSPILGDSILIDLAGERAENLEGGVSPVMPEVSEEVIELTDAEDDFRMAFREIDESRVGFRIDDAEADDEIVFTAYLGVVFADWGELRMLRRLPPMVVLVLFVGVSSRPNSSKAVETSEALLLGPAILPRLEPASDDFKAG